MLQWKHQHYAYGTFCPCPTKQNKGTIFKKLDGNKKNHNSVKKVRYLTHVFFNKQIYTHANLLRCEAIQIPHLKSMREDRFDLASLCCTMTSMMLPLILSVQGWKGNCLTNYHRLLLPTSNSGTQYLKRRQNKNEVF